ncbi:MAG: hypothetical protein AAGK37_06015 [Pseudomonadota bacterium]
MKQPEMKPRNRAGFFSKILSGGLKIIRWVILLAGWAGSSAASEIYEPAVGSIERKRLLDAIRPHAEWELGAPIEFNVMDIRVNGDLAFVQLNPQRPGGGEIDLAKSPMVARGVPLNMLDGARLEALLVKEGETWVALLHLIGATDLWFSSPEICTFFRPVIPDYCP